MTKMHDESISQKRTTTMNNIYDTNILAQFKAILVNASNTFPVTRYRRVLCPPNIPAFFSQESLLLLVAPTCHVLCYTWTRCIAFMPGSPLVLASVWMRVSVFGSSVFFSVCVFYYPYAGTQHHHTRPTHKWDASERRTNERMCMRCAPPNKPRPKTWSRRDERKNPHMPTKRE